MYFRLRSELLHHHPGPVYKVSELENEDVSHNVQHGIGHSFVCTCLESLSWGLPCSHILRVFIDCAQNPNNRTEDMSAAFAALIHPRWLIKAIDPADCLQLDVLSTLLVETNTTDEEGAVSPCPLLALM